MKVCAGKAEQAENNSNEVLKRVHNGKGLTIKRGPKKPQEAGYVGSSPTFVSSPRRKKRSLARIGLMVFHQRCQFLIKCQELELIDLGGGGDDGIR